MNQWRRFQFFEDRSPVGPLADALAQGVRCGAGGRGRLAVGTESGSVLLLDRSLQVRRSFVAHEGPVAFLHLFKQRSCLLTVGKEAKGAAVMLWDLDKAAASGGSSGASGAAAAEGGAPTLLRTYNIFSDAFPAAQITACAIREAPQLGYLLAVGLATGAVDVLLADSSMRIKRLRIPPNSSQGQGGIGGAGGVGGGAGGGEGAGEGGGRGGRGGDALGAGEGRRGIEAAGLGAGGRSDHSPSSSPPAPYASTSASALASTAENLPPVAVTGLGFRILDSGPQLFIVTGETVTLYTLPSGMFGAAAEGGWAGRGVGGGGGGGWGVVLEERGGDVFCSAMTDTQDLVVARPEAFYCFNEDGPGACFGLDGPKHRLACLRGYLLCLHSPPSPAASAASAAAGPTTTGGGGGSGGSGGGGSGGGESGKQKHQQHQHHHQHQQHQQQQQQQKMVLSVYDTRNKLMVHSAPLTPAASLLVPLLLLCEGGAVVLLSLHRRGEGGGDAGGGVQVEARGLLLVERDMAWKLEALFRKGLYSSALDLVVSQGGDAAATAEVLRRYGDHLYAKQDYEEAMGQYERTIGQVEPSYVIQRYLHAQRLSLLARYLERLHDKGVATPDHTTLLINCFSRLKDVSKLDAFVRAGFDAPSSNTHSIDPATAATPKPSSAPSSASTLPLSLSLSLPHTSSASPTLPYDPDTVIQVCCSAGYYNQALFVSQRAAKHSAYLKILVEDLHHYADGLAFISALADQAKIVSAAREYGPVLAAHLPEETISLFLELCTGFGSSRDGGGGVGAGTVSTGGGEGSGGTGAGPSRFRDNRESASPRPSPGASSGAAAAVDAAAGTAGGAAGAVAPVTIPPRSSSFRKSFVSGSGRLMGSPGSSGSGSAGPKIRITDLWQQQKYLSPMELAPVFVDQPRCLMKFLEAYVDRVIDSPWHKDVLNSLLELYLCYETSAVLPSSSSLLSDSLSSPDSELPSFESVLKAAAAAATGAADSACGDSMGSSFLSGDSARTDPVRWAERRMLLGQQKEREAASSNSSSSSAAISTSFIPPSPSSLTSPPAAAAAATASGTGASGEGGGGRGGIVSPISAEGNDRAACLAKAGALLRAYWQQQSAPRYDADLALLTCQVHGFRDGLIFLYERMRLFKEALAMHMREGDSKGLIAACKRLGDAGRGGDPSVWADVVRYLGERGEACGEEVAEVLSAVERGNLLPPLLVLQTLSRNPHITVGEIRDYVSRHLQQEAAIIEEDRRAIEKYQHETDKYRKELHQLLTEPLVFQSSRCAECNSSLDLPAVHFFCLHAFHLRCLADPTTAVAAATAAAAASMAGDVGGVSGGGGMMGGGVGGVGYGEARRGGYGGGMGAVDGEGGEEGEGEEGGMECPKCAASYRVVREMRVGLRQSAADHDRFFQELHDARDGFGVVALYFGRGLVHAGESSMEGAL
ncbi:unnamed protein product [Closterium sp. NIES-53]